MTMTSVMSTYTPRNYHQALMNRLGIVGDWADSGLANTQAYWASRAQQTPSYSSMGGTSGGSSSGGGINYSPPSGQAGNTFENFLRAIAQRESGGNYRARNPDSGALGKYQIMPGNIPSWSKQILGFSITPSQFYQSPKYQEQIAQGMLRNYYNKWGPGGAAVAWYAGPGTAASWFKNRNRGYYNTPQGKYSSINAYALGIMRAMGIR